MNSWDDTERAALVALLRRSKEWTRQTNAVIDAGSAVSVLRPEGTLFDLGDPIEDDLERAGQDIGRWRAEGLGFLTFMDDDYPPQLREIQEMPPILFWMGDLVMGDRAVSVVGSRRASAQGIAFARATAMGLVDAGISVVAGLAAGIDTAAHRAAMEAGGRTVAVIGTGIRRSYPSENAALQERIAREGLLLSQFLPDAPPSKWSFPARNAVMSGYGRATVIVEAGEHSGTRSQARMAVAHGRPVVLARTVAEGTSWGRSMTGTPGVFVCDSPAGAVDLAVGLARTVEDHIAALGHTG